MCVVEAATPRIVVADSDALLDLGARLAQRLAHFLRDESRVVIALCVQLFCCIAQYFGALRKCGLRPCLLRGMVFFQRLFQTDAVPTGAGLEQLAGGRDQACMGHE